MKKIQLFLALAVAVIGLSASAASVRWQIVPGSVTSPTDSSTLLGGSVIYLLSGTSSDASATLASIVAGTWSATASNVVGSGNLIANAGGTGALTAENSNWGTSEALSLYVVVLDGTDLASSTYALVSGISEAQTLDSTGAGVSGTWDSTAISATSNGWVKIGTVVPEPTVLALLALGVAGMALKRRV